MKPINDVDEYIALAPKEMQARFQELRACIVAAAPNAQESMSYGMPYYRYKRHLIYFALCKKHIGLYALTSPVLEEHKSELEGCVTPKGTVQLSLDKELPTALIESLVTAQVIKNDETEKGK